MIFFLLIVKIPEAIFLGMYQFFSQFSIALIFFFVFYFVFLTLSPPQFLWSDLSIGLEK